MSFVNVDERSIHYDCPPELPSRVGHTMLPAGRAGPE